MATVSRTAKSLSFRASACVKGSLCTLCHHDNTSSTSEWVYPFHLVILSDQHGNSCVHAGRVQTSNHTKPYRPGAPNPLPLHQPRPVRAHTLHLFVLSGGLTGWHWGWGRGGRELLGANKIFALLFHLCNGLLKPAQSSPRPPPPWPVHISDESSKKLEGAALVCFNCADFSSVTHTTPQIPKTLLSSHVKAQPTPPAVSL